MPHWHVLARVETSDGVEGIGYIVYPRGDLMPAIAHATRELGEHLIGHHVLGSEASVANGGMLEYMPRSEAILQTMPEFVDGHVIAPTAAGLGLTLDTAAVERFRVR